MRHLRLLLHPDYMTSPATFQRARRPEQKEERRQHLLDTAKTILIEGLDVHEMSLNELARRAEMTKSNVYRYFENREELLLALLEEQSYLWQRELHGRLAAETGRASTLEWVADTIADVTVSRPLMCRLLSVLPSVIEHNVSPERLAEFKRGVVAMQGALAQELHRHQPKIAAARFLDFLRLAIPLLVGLWPFSQPAAALAGVLALPDLKSVRYSFRPDLASGLLLLLRGLKA